MYAQARDKFKSYIVHQTSDIPELSGENFAVQFW